LWIGGVLAVVIALVAVFLLTRSDDQPSVVQGEEIGPAISQTNEVSIEGAALPELQDIETAAGTPAPQVRGVSFDGESITLVEFGKPTVIGFFAHWCPHCQTEVDELSKYLATTGLPDDVNVMAVSTGVDSSRGNFPPSAWFESEGWPGPVLTDDALNSAAKSYGLSAFPFWAVVDAEGKIVSRSAGGIGPDQFDAYLELARAGN
jgi:thiol-disulfide isomerase/thioredoxin